MAKLTKRDRETLRTALAALERTADYLARDTVEVAVHTSMTDALVYRNDAGGPPLYRISKEYGSPLSGIGYAREILGEFLATH